MPDLNEKLNWFSAAVDACRGRIDPQLQTQAQELIERVDRRLSMSRDLSVIALTGATGSGKSSIFNALSRTALAEPGVRRPMTQEAMAITFGSTDSTALLDSLGVTRRHVAPAQGLGGVVLLDLADCDSVVTSHREEVDHILTRSDLFFWVVDPQKYADMTLHEQYLRRWIGYDAIMAVILNQIDRLNLEQVATIHQDLVRLLQEDGLANPVVFDVSAVTGQGMDQLRRYVVQVASAKQAMGNRLLTDVVQVARLLRQQVGNDPVGSVGGLNLRDVSAACEEVVGVAQIGAAVRDSVERQGRLATGWPLSSWLTRMKPDPLKRLRLDRPRGDESGEAPIRSVVHPAGQARIDTALRGLGNEAGAKLPRSWKGPLDRVIRRQGATLLERLDEAVLATDVASTQPAGWWKMVRVLQWVIMVCTVGGALWLLVNLVSTAAAGSPALVPPHVGGMSLPAWLFLGGVVLGLVVAGLSRIGVRVGAKVSGSAAVRHLRRSLDKVVAAEIIEPVNLELSRHDAALMGLDRVIAP